MKIHRMIACIAVAAWSLSAAEASEKLTVTVEHFKDGEAIPPIYALCKGTPDGKSGPGMNLRPSISWNAGPAATKSYAIIVSDPDVPADFSNAGKEGKIVASDAPRQVFYHWALTDIPSGARSVTGGAADAAIGFGTPVLNDLKDYLPNAHFYGGPCPPWNDKRVHHYHFTVYALDMKSLELKPQTTAKELATMLENSTHVLAKGEQVGTYTLNLELLAK